VKDGLERNGKKTFVVCLKIISEIRSNRLKNSQKYSTTTASSEAESRVPQVEFKKQVHKNVGHDYP
jgi:hypothetical protein